MATNVDFFSSSFNAETVLNDLKLPLNEAESFESVNEFEQHLWNTNATLVEELQKLELRENAEKKPSVELSRKAHITFFEKLNITSPLLSLQRYSGNISARHWHGIQADFDFEWEARYQKLAQMCAKRGRTVFESVPELRGNLNEKWNGNFLKIDQQGPMKRLRECVEQGQLVHISLRGRSRVNAFIEAKVVAFDKHWNLLIRDGDESFKPSVRMKRRITKSMRIAAPHQYFESQCKNREGKTKTLWRRHLPFSLIRGDDVILIFISP